MTSGIDGASIPPQPVSLFHSLYELEIPPVAPPIKPPIPFPTEAPLPPKKLPINEPIFAPILYPWYAPLISADVMLAPPLDPRQRIFPCEAVKLLFTS